MYNNNSLPTLLVVAYIQSLYCDTAICIAYCIIALAKTCQKRICCKVRLATSEVYF